MNDELIKRLERKLDELVAIQKHLLAIRLSERGVKQVEIGKHLKLATGTIGKMLKGAQHRDG